MTVRPGGAWRESPERFVRRLESWKAIASYLNRHVTTVRRWEQLEGLPVHRHVHGALGSVYAFTSELDDWFEGRRHSTGDPAAAPAVVPIPVAFPLPPPILAHTPSPAALIGREEEWRVLEARWDAARQGRHQLVAITGEAGIGKTRLAYDFARRVAADATVLVGRCDPDAGIPFAPVVEVLRWLVRASPEGFLRSRLAAVEGHAELVHLVPELSAHTRARARSVRTTPEGERFRVFEAVASLLRATAAVRPLLVVLEDVHWADRGTLLLLRHVFRSTYDSRICTLVTRCDAESANEPGQQDVLADLRGDPGTSRVSLGPLPEHHVHRLVGACLGEPAVPHLARLVAGSTGNPLFAIELVKHFDAPALRDRLEIARGEATLAELGLPQELQGLIGRRLSRLAEPTQTLLTIAAVAGREFDLPLVEAVAELPERVLLDAIDEAVDVRMLREVDGRPGRFTFTHGVLRDAIYGRMTSVRRLRLHHRLGEEIERQRKDCEGALAELAHHFCQAAPFRDAPKAVDYATRAAEAAAAGLALEEAARHHAMALRALDFVSPGPAVPALRFLAHERRGWCFSQVGDWASAMRDFESALALLEPGDEERRCELLVKLAEAAFWLMDVPGLRRFASEAQRLAEILHRDDLWGDARAWSASADVSDGNLTAAVESDRSAIARAGGIRSLGLARAPLTLYWAGHTAEAVERAAEAVARARRSDDPAFLLYALQHAGLSLSGAGRYDEALRTFEEALEFGRRCASLPLLARATAMGVAPLLGLGDLPAAEMRAVEARQLAHRISFEAPWVSAGIDLAVIAARSGEVSRGEAMLAELGPAVHRAGGWHGWKWRLRLWHARAELAMARGSYQEALAAATHVVEQSRARQRPKYEALGLSIRACAQARLGVPRAPALDDAREAASVARALGDPAVLLACLSAWLALERSEELLGEARDTVARMAAAVHEDGLRRRFLSSLPYALEIGG